VDEYLRGHLGLGLVAIEYIVVNYLPIGNNDETGTRTGQRNIGTAIVGAKAKVHRLSRSNDPVDDDESAWSPCIESTVETENISSQAMSSF
jgi:hypothetical protein